MKRRKIVSVQVPSSGVESERDTIRFKLVTYTSVSILYLNKFEVQYVKFIHGILFIHLNNLFTSTRTTE